MPPTIQSVSYTHLLAELLRLRQICCDPSLCFPRYKGGSAKLETCMELLENGTRAGHKLLLFSQFTSMLDVIAGRLSKEKIRFYMLTGATPKGRRMQMVSDFHKDDVMVFLISLKAGGTGLNLTAADVVIHYDPVSYTHLMRHMPCAMGKRDVGSDAPAEDSFLLWLYPDDYLRW